jgi:hypothetical protein
MMIDGLFDDNGRPNADALPDPARPREDAVGRAHPPTSRRAAHEARFRAGSQCGLIMAALRDRGQRGLTAAEAAPIIRRSRNQAAARLWQLRNDGWVVYLLDERGLPVERATDDGEGRFTGQVHVLA